MTQDPITVDLTFTASFCNAWPELVVEANGQTVWHDHVQETATVTLQFPRQEHNQVRIKYINKRNGPDIWDTAIDDQGRIVQDQHAILTSIRISGAQCDWIIDSLLWNYVDGRSQANRGFMDLQGWADIEFPGQVYEWIMEQRQSRIINTGKTSALDYKNIYIPSKVNQASLDIIEEIKHMVQRLNG